LATPIICSDNNHRRRGWPSGDARAYSAVAGDNAFCYFVDSSGNVLEYTAKVGRVDDASWKTTVYAPSFEITDQWGASVLTGGPESMPKNRLDPGLFHAPPV
jgi:hypothetical protein